MSKLSGQAQELIHRCEIMPTFVTDGFIPYIPEFDLGVDFILYREADDALIKVQQKSRWYVDRKYLERRISILFRHRPRDETRINQDQRDKNWFLVPHGKLVEVANSAEYLDTKSWHRGIVPKPSYLATHGEDGSKLLGAYGGDRMGPKMEEQLLRYDLHANADREFIYHANQQGLRT